jgi:hypothetical protein
MCYIIVHTAIRHLYAEPLSAVAIDHIDDRARIRNPHMCVDDVAHQDGNNFKLDIEPPHGSGMPSSA